MVDSVRRQEPMGAGRYIGLMVLALLIPVLAVGIEFGCEHEMTVVLLLWFFVPFGGQIYAWVVITRARHKSRRKSRYPLAEEGREARPQTSTSKPPLPSGAVPSHENNPEQYKQQETAQQPSAAEPVSTDAGRPTYAQAMEQSQSSQSADMIHASPRAETNSDEKRVLSEVAPEAHPQD